MRKYVSTVFLLFLLFPFLANAQSVTASDIYKYAKEKNYRGLFNSQQYIDAEDYQGDTALCMAYRRNDSDVIRTLISYGANPRPNCLNKIIAAAQTASGATFAGMGATGWTITGVAVAGAGVAAAAAGGGGGGGGGSECAGFLGDDGVCYDKLACEHGHQDKAVCVCDNGYKGTLCDEINTCSSDYQTDGGCGAGYWQNTSDICYSAESTLYKCISRTKTEGCKTYDPYSDNCMSCIDEGYDLIGGACVVHDCGSDYAAVGSCTNGWNNNDQTQCKSGTTTLYQCQSHTTVDNCSTYSKTQDACTKCSGGYDLSDNTCNIHICGDNYAAYGECATGWNNKSQTQCKSGSTTLYLCHNHTTVEHCLTYSKTSNKCSSCYDGWDVNTSTNQCGAHNCGDNYAAIGMCISGWNNYDQITCKSADTTLYQCHSHTSVEHCITYSKMADQCATCDAGYQGSTCSTCADGYKKWGAPGDDTCYTTLTCQHNTTQFEDYCNCADTGFTGTTCGDCASGQTDPSGDICYAKLACEHGTTQSGNQCNCADTGFSGATCGDCASGDIVDDVCYPDAHCEHGMSQTAGVCQCTDGWSGTTCGDCSSGQSVGDICYDAMTCEHGGHQEGGECVCINGWSGSDCTTCNTTSSGDYCYDKPLVCEHGVMGENGCECDANWSGTLCDLCPSGNIDGDTCYSYPLECHHGGSVEDGTCNCTGGWTGRTCDICPSGDSSGDTCYPSAGCKHGATQSGGECQCKYNWDGPTCETCAGTEAGDVCYLDANCIHGQYIGSVCTCFNNWNGEKCDNCDSGQSSGNICFETLSCVHGYQSLGICICDKGWTGTLCDEGISYNNYNKEKSINVEKEDSTTPVVGLEYTTTGDKIGSDPKALYNAYVKSDSTSLNLDDTYLINVTSTNPQTQMNTYGLKNDVGSVYGVYVDGTEETITGNLKSEINVTYVNNSYDSNTTYSLYGIYANGDITAIKKKNADSLEVTNEINVKFEDKYAYDNEHKNRLSRINLYGLYSLKGDVENSAGSSVNLSSVIENKPSSWEDNNQPYSYMFGAYSARGNVTNMGSVLLDGATGGPIYGLYAMKTADNRGNVSVTGTSEPSGIFGYQEAKNSGNVTSQGSSGYSYGIRSYGNITNTNGSVTASVSSGKAYGLYANSAVTNTNSTVSATGSQAYGISANSTVTSSGGTINATGSSDVSYGIYTTGGNVTNSSTITASGYSNTYGIKASAIVDNSNGSITATSSHSSSYGIQTNDAINNQNGHIGASASNGSAYGIYTASGSTNNQNGQISATSSYTYGSAYGIYTTESVDLSKVGTVSANATGSQSTAVGVYFGQGNLVLNDTNTQYITATSSNIRYLFEGATGTSITNTASINAGLKASVVSNTGTIGGARYGINAMNAATNSGTVTANFSGSYSGANTYGIYANSTVDNTNGTVQATGSSSSAYGLSTYGIYSENGSIENTQGNVSASGYSAYGLATKNESINNTKGSVSASSNSSSSYGSAYGISTTSGAVNNEEGSVTATSSTSGSAYGIRTTSSAINNKKANISVTTTSYSGAAYGIITTSGTVDNSEATITATASTSYGQAYGINTSSSAVDNTLATITAKGYQAYGIKTEGGDIDNRRGTISSTGSQSAYGIYTTNGAINNLRGTIVSSTTMASTGSAYGIYTNSAIDLSKLGSVSATSNEGTAVAVHFGTGEISLNNSNTSSISATGNNIRYLFEGAAGTTIKNSATIEAGLKASFVENSGTINGGKYGIYAMSSVTNTGVVYASSGSTAYGIWTDGAVDLTKIGTVSASAADLAVGIHFGSGTVNLNDSNVQNITVTGEGIRYLFEGATGTTIFNSAAMAAGLKAGNIENSGNISGGQYGVYALNSVSNTSSGTISGDQYGIYSDGSATNAGTINSSRYGLYSIDKATNSGTITTSGSSYSAYGIYTQNDADNTNGTVSVTTTSAQAIGVYADGLINNTGGKVTAQTSTGTAYGLYTMGSVDLSKIGTITAKATSTNAGTAVGVHFGSGTIELSNTDIQNMTVTGSNIRYLFEGETGTTIRNAANISAGLRAGTIENTCTISAGRYGLYGTTSVTNSGTVTANSSASDTVQGIYSGGTVDNSTGTVNATSTYSNGEAYGIWTNGSINKTTLGTINVAATTTGGKAIGVHFGDETLTLTNDDLANLNKITLTGKERYLFEGGTNTTITNMTNISAGLSSISGTIENRGNINAKNVGISVSGESSEVHNYSNIIVTPASTTQTYPVYGIFAKENAYVYNDASGTIKVSNASSTSSKAYGVYLNKSELNNQGLIQINAPSSSYTSGSYGIYAINGSTVRNSGTITRTINNASPTSCEGDACYTGVKDHPPFIYLDSTSTYINAALTMSMAPLNFSQDFGKGKVLLTKGGSYQAPSLSGTLGIDDEVMSDGFENQYVLTDAIISDDTSDLTIASNSALFDAVLDGQNILLNKKAFQDVIENNSVASFLEENYQAANNEGLFQMLKSKENISSLNEAVKDLTGSEMFNRLTFEDLTMMRDLGSDINQKLFENKKEYFETAGNITPWNFNGNSGSNSRYALYNTTDGNHSTGLSVAFSDIRSNDGHKNDNSRYDQSFYMGVPMGYSYKGLRFITTPSFGYAYGTYERNGYEEKTYDGKIEKRILALTNEVRYPFGYKDWTFAPAVELNAFGYHMKGGEEKGVYSLNIPGQNNYSLESGIGFHVINSREINKNQKLSFNASMMLYHEFAHPYETKLKMNGMDGSFKITDDERKSDRVVLRTGLGYQLSNDVSLNASFAAYFDGKLDSKSNLNFKYGF